MTVVETLHHGVAAVFAAADQRYHLHLRLVLGERGVDFLSF